MHVPDLLLSAIGIQNQNQEPTSRIKSRKQLLKQNSRSLRSDKYFLLWNCSHFLWGKPSTEDLRENFSQKQSKIV